MALKNQIKNVIAKYQSIYKFEKREKKWNSILTFLSLLCEFEENLSIKVALVINWLRRRFFLTGSEVINYLYFIFLPCWSVVDSFSGRPRRRSDGITAGRPRQVGGHLGRGWGEPRAVCWARWSVGGLNHRCRHLRRRPRCRLWPPFDAAADDVAAVDDAHEDCCCWYC